MENIAEKHRGEILENLIRKSPYSITILANKLGISRTTLYNKFKEPNLDYDFMLLVGDVLHYDVSSVIPELDTRVVFSLHQQYQRVRILEKQYVDLLERYKNLLIFLTKVAHQHGLSLVKQQIDRLAENNG
jgi:hypothetical protein